ncbi:MAG TPA: DUF4168 domain-containing protein [Allocoleopsis sp.]
MKIAALMERFDLQPFDLKRWLTGLQRFFLMGLSLLWSWGIASPVAFAQDPTDAIDFSEPEISVPSHFGLDASAISSEKISQFVQAYLKVVGLIEDREGALQAAETESESMQMQQTVQAEALDVIKSEGLTLQEYLQLLGLANIDPEFGERVAAQLQEATE